MSGDGWETVTLADVCTNIQDGAHRSPQVLHNESAPGRFLYITSKNIRTGYMKLDNVQYCESDFHEAIYRRCNAEFGDVLLTKDGASTGNVCLNSLDEPISLLSSVCLLKTDPQRLLSKFLYYYIRSDHGFRQITGQMTGAAIKRIILRTIKKSEMPLPPLAEQKRIVSILDEAFSAIAKAKENAEKNLLAARELFESYLNRVFTQQGPGWQEKPLGELGKTQTGSTPKKANQHHYGDHIPFVKPADFNVNGSLETGNDGLSEEGLEAARLVPANSALMVCIGATIGKSGFTDSPITTNQQINAFIPNESVDHQFAYYSFVTQRFQRHVERGSGQATLPIINKTKWSAIQLCFPELSEQRRIVAELDELRASQLRLETIYSQKLANLDELKQSLLQKAFTGQLKSEAVA